MCWNCSQKLQSPCLLFYLPSPLLQQIICIIVYDTPFTKPPAQSLGYLTAFYQYFAGFGRCYLKKYFHFCGLLVLAKLMCKTTWRKSRLPIYWPFAIAYKIINQINTGTHSVWLTTGHAGMVIRQKRGVFYQIFYQTCMMGLIK